jgi:Transposase DDE domain
MSRRNRVARKRLDKSQRLGADVRAVQYKEHLAGLLEWFLPDEGIFAKLKFHGNTTWSPQSLVWLAIYWAWSESRNLTDAFTQAVECYRKSSRPLPVRSYTGFMLALTRWTPRLLDILWLVLHKRMEESGGRFWRIGKWVPIAFDGSRSSAPRSELNEKAFCAPNYGKGTTAKYRKKKTKGLRRKKNQRNPSHPQEPQAWITMMWHMGLCLPWMWRLGPSNSSERTHVLEMLSQWCFPVYTLFCGDAGFIGYQFWSDILQGSADFLVRVGANVSLLTEYVDLQFEKGGTVLCWPRNAIKAKQAPLRLRLLKVRIGKTTVWMLTSVLDRADLTVKQMVKFYEMRWGIEVEFRGLKQTLDRAKLRSRNDQRLLVELNWSIMAMAIAELFALKEQLAKRNSKATRAQPAPDPTKRSLAQTMRALRVCLRNLNELPQPGEDLLTLLRTAVTDNYERTSSKQARYRPRNPDKKPLGDPKIRRLNPAEEKKLNEYVRKKAA